MSNARQLPENVTALTTASRRWNGVDVELVEYTCTGRILVPLKRREDAIRLGTKLEEVGRGYAEPRSAPDVPNPHAYTRRPMYLAPAGMPIWGYAADARYLRCAAISFDAGLLRDRLGMCDAPQPMDAPRLRFSDDRVWTLIRLLADAIGDPDPTSQLYGDSLVAAIAARLCERPSQAKGSAHKLSAIQLRDALSYLEASMPARVELATLAQLAGLSQSHYCRAFKATTGLAPYQWQLQARVERAKHLLLDTNGRLEDVAAATGFADAVHFGRTFRKMTGATPAAWRLDMRS